MPNTAWHFCCRVINFHLQLFWQMLWALCYTWLYTVFYFTSRHFKRGILNLYLLLTKTWCWCDKSSHSLPVSDLSNETCLKDLDCDVQCSAQMKWSSYVLHWKIRSSERLNSTACSEGKQMPNQSASLKQRWTHHLADVKVKKRKKQSVLTVCRNRNDEVFTTFVILCNLV